MDKDYEINANENNDNEDIPNMKESIISQTRTLAIIQESPTFNIVFVFGKQLFKYEILSPSSFKKISTIEYSDDILSFYAIDSNDVIIAGKQNKSISRLKFNSEGKVESEFIFVHNKKLSSLLLINELNEMYMMFSDKFGEIHIKTTTEDKEAFSQKGKILFGHCDPVTFIQLSPNRKLLLSADSFGKIKVYQFPNCFNVLTVLLYKNDEIRYVNFISEEAIIVLTNENELHLWSTYDFLLNEKYKLEIESNDLIVAIGVLGLNLFYIETKSTVECFNIDVIQRKLIPYKPHSKSMTAKATGVFMFNNNIIVALFNSDYTLDHFDSISLLHK